MSNRIFFLVCLFLHLLISCSEGDDGTKSVSVNSLSDYEMYKGGILPDSLVPVIRDLYDNALHHKDIHAMSTCNNILSNYYMLTGRYEEGFSFANDFLLEIADVKDNDYIFDAYYNIGKLYYGLGLSEIALGYFLNLTKYEISPINQCRALYAVAEASRTSDTYGLDPGFYYRKAETLARQIDEPVRISDALFGQSQVYFESLDIYTKKDMPMSLGRMDSLNRGISLLEEALSYAPSNYVINCALGLNYAAKKEFDTAEKFIRKGYELTTQIPDVLPLGLNVLSAYNICKGDYRQAILNATESYNMASKWNKKGDMANASSILYYAYKYMGDMGSALTAYENYIQLTNDLSSEERQIQVQYNQVELDTRLKEEQLKAAEKENGLYFRTILITTFLLLMLTVLFISYYLSYRKKRSAYRELVLKSQQWAEVETENLIIQEEENEADEDVVEENELPESYDLELLQRIEKLMREEKAYVDSELTIDLVARKLHENRYYVSHAINKCLLKNFNTYVNEYRIKEAIRLMSDAQAEKLSINEIAYDSGFNDRKNFYRVFKKNTGLSPSVFRNNLQQTN